LSMSLGSLWHLAQVAAMFLGYADDEGSRTRTTSCAFESALWQSAHVAGSLLPPGCGAPWTLFMYWPYSY
jgi:hypothetical protein